jgi:hypothetical protein
MTHEPCTCPPMGHDPKCLLHPGEPTFTATITVAPVSEYTPTTDEIRSGFLALHGHSPRYEEAFDRWLAKHDRDVAAKAWDEGYEVGNDDGYGGGHTPAVDPKSRNPYRGATS